MRNAICVVIVLIVAEQAYAINSQDINCSSSTTWCASSCSLNDVQSAVINALSSNNNEVTVYVPACSATWTLGTSLYVATGMNKSIKLIGSGQSNTIIKNFQISIPSDTSVSHITEWAHMTIYADNNTTLSPLSSRLRCEPPGRQLYWHDLTIDSYKTNYVLHLEGWKGLISHITMKGVDIPSGQNNYGIAIHGDGVYSAHKNDLGTSNALFIEDSTFSYYSHTVSLFCDAYVVFRYNNVNYADAYLDIHGPGYNGCSQRYAGVSAPNDKHAGGGYEIYNNTFNNYTASWLVSPRAGSAGIIANNTVGIAGSESFFVAVRADTGCCGNSVNCGNGPGKTCNRKYSINTNDGCTQMEENWYIWNNTCSHCKGEIYLYPETTCGAECVRENTDYYNRAPTLLADGFSWIPYTYPHPISISGLPPLGKVPKIVKDVLVR